MPNQQNVNMTDGCKRFDEAIRGIEKYQYKAEKEPNALLDTTMDALNGIYYTNPCMHHKKGARNIAKGLKAFYKTKVGKDPSSDASICTCIVTMPKDFIKAHYNISDHEYVLLDKFFNDKTLNSYELQEVETLKKRLVHPQWTKEEQQRIHQFFMATTYIYCKQAGIKGPKVFFKKDENGNDFVNEQGQKVIERLDFDGSDVLWSVSHLSESFPHLHLGFLPLAYMKDKTPLEEYEKARELRTNKIQELVDSGVDKKIATKSIPNIKRPYSLEGDLYREIEKDEKPIGCTVRRFKNTYLRNLNSTLEKGLKNDFGIDAHIATGAGSKFDVQKTKRKERFEGSTIEKAYEELKQEKERIEFERVQAEAKASAIKSELDVTTKQLESVQEELTIAINEKELAEAKASTYEEQVAKATRELDEMNDALEEKEIELQDKVAQIDSLKDIINELKLELTNLVKEVVMFVPNVIKSFIKGWKDAKTNVQKEEIDNQARAKALAGANQMTEHLRVLGSKAEALLVEEEIVNGVKMATFNQTDQKIGFAKNQILKSAELCGKAEVFADRRVMALALQDWFDKDKHKARISNMSELDASLYMKFPNRAARAIDFAVEKIQELEYDIGR